MDMKIAGEYITLGQPPKVTDFIQSSGEAKFAVKSLKINVDEEQENRRGRKLYAGDIIDIEGSIFSLS